MNTNNIPKGPPNEKLQYFSKWRSEWIDFGRFDSVESYEKYGYKIRVNPNLKK